MIEDSFSHSRAQKYVQMGLLMLLCQHPHGKRKKSEEARETRTQHGAAASTLSPPENRAVLRFLKCL